MNQHSFELSVNTGFLVNRYTDPSQWVKLISDYIGVKNIQFTADLINPSLPDDLILKKVDETKSYLEKYQVNATSALQKILSRMV
jgi:hypothetical protein